MVQPNIPASGRALAEARPPVDDADRAAEPSPPSLQRVFGISRDVPLSYVRRAQVDGQLVLALNRDRHVLLSGASKQGKSLAWRVALAQANPLVVPCGPSTTRAQIHAAILRRAGASVTVSDREAPSGERSLLVEVPRSTVPEAGGGRVGTTAATARFGLPTLASGSGSRFEVDPLAPVEIAGILEILDGRGVRRVVVIDEFHQLPEPVRKEMAANLKAFHDCSRILFVVMMVQDGRTPMPDALALNPDLRDRVVRIDADLWTEADLLRIMAKGEMLLNVRFPAVAKAEILEYARGQVARVQELCLILCQRAGVWGPEEETKKVGSVEEVREILFQGMVPGMA